MGARIDGDFNYSTYQICCSKCDNKGAILWDEVQTARGPDRQFVKLSGAFSEIVSRKPPHRIEIICHVCGARQPMPEDHPPRAPDGPSQEA